MDPTDLMKMQFQIEELYSNGELSFSEKDRMVRHAFHRYSGRRESDQNCLYGKDSVRMQATQSVIQAVGRMCRTLCVYCTKKALNNCTDSLARPSCINLRISL